MKAYDEEGNLLDPADFGEEDYVTEGLEKGADYVIATSDTFPHPPEFYPSFVMPGEDLGASKRQALKSGHIYRVWDLTRIVIGAPPPTVTPPPEPLLEPLAEPSPEPPAATEPIDPPAHEEPPPAQYEAPREFFGGRREPEPAAARTESEEPAQVQNPGFFPGVGWLGFVVAVIGASAAHHVWGSSGAGPEDALVFGLIGAGFGWGYVAGLLTSSMCPRS